MGEDDEIDCFNSSIPETDRIALHLDEDGNIRESHPVVDLLTESQRRTLSLLAALLTLQSGVIENMDRRGKGLPLLSEDCDCECSAALGPGDIAGRQIKLCCPQARGYHQFAPFGLGLGISHSF
jgi:hypothetical protein